MMNLDDIAKIDQEIQTQTDLLKTNTEGLEQDIQQFREVSETLNLLVTENADLEQRLAASEVKYTELQQQITELEEVLKKRDDAMKFLLKTVNDLNSRVTLIRNALSGQAS